MKKILIFTILPLLIAVSAWASTEYFPNIYVSGDTRTQDLNVTGTVTGVEGGITPVENYSDNLTKAKNQIGSDNVTIRINSVITQNSNLTLPENIELFFERGGKVIGNSNLSINGQIRGGAWDIFGSGITLNSTRDFSTTFNTISELENFTPTGAWPGVAIVKGYSSTDDGGGGTFHWDTSKTMSDEDNGTIVGATADGAWVREYEGPINLLWFGADRSGSTDTSTEVIEWLSAGDAVETRLYAPQGDYLLTSRATLSTSGLEMSILGDGPEITRFIVDSTNTVGGISITLSDKTSQIKISNLSILADGESLGTGLNVSQPVGGNRHNRGLILRDVEVKGIAAATDYFDTFINLDGMWRPLIDNVIVGGPFGPGVSDDFSDSSYLYKANIGIDLDDCYGPSIKDTFIWSASVGLSSESAENPGPESLYMKTLVINGCKTAIEFQRPAREPTFWLMDSHINFRDIGIDIDGLKLAKIDGLVSYNQDTLETYTGTPFDILLDNTEKISVTNSQFHFDGPDDRINIFTNATTNADTFIISDNIFNSLASEGIRIGSGSTNALIANNEFPGTITTNINDLSGSASIFGRTANKEYTFEDQADNSSEGPNLRLYRNSSSPLDNDVIGYIQFEGKNSGGTDIPIAQLNTVMTDVTSGTEDGEFKIYVKDNGSLNAIANFKRGTTDTTGLMIEVDDSGIKDVRRVSIGSDDSCGTGYKCLRVPN